VTIALPQIALPQIALPRFAIPQNAPPQYALPGFAPPHRLLIKLWLSYYGCLIMAVLLSLSWFLPPLLDRQRPHREWRWAPPVQLETSIYQ
jgi:hypothetical protein